MAFQKSSKKANDDAPKFEIIEDYGVISESGKYEKRLRLISWNENEPKYDIRAWSKEDPNKMQKGITLTGEEMESLLKLMNKIAEA